MKATIFFIALAVVCLWAIFEVVRDARRWKAWAADLRAGQPTSWATENPSSTVLVHVAVDGELVEYPIIDGCSMLEVAEFLAEVDRLPEVPV